MQLNNLVSITDHAKINVDSREYQRINEGLKLYQNKPLELEYLNSNGYKRKRKQATINMLKKVSNYYATLVFNEQCEIEVSGQASEFIEKVFAHNDFKKNLSKYLEPMFALGGLACRPYVDSKTKQIEFSWALADAFYPLESNSNNISECAIPFRSQRAEGKETIYYTLLEFHEWQEGTYTITNELYRSTKASEVGVRIPLKELYADLEEQTTFSNLSRPLFAYLKPSGFNNLSPHSALGLGVADNCRHTLDTINRTYDEFEQEIIRGKRRIAVSEMMLNTRYDEDGKPSTFFDDSEDVFQKVPSSNLDDFTITDLTSEIRTTQYIAAINHHLKTLELETGLSVGTFAFDMQGVRSTKTATEIVSENSQTYQTRSMQVIEVEKFIKELVVSVCELGLAFELYSGKVPTFAEIGVSFDDGAFNSQSDKLNFYQKLIALGYPVNRAFEAILKLPEDKANELYQEGLRNTATQVSGIFTQQGLDAELE